MARGKVTITLGGTLGRLIQAQQLRRDAAAYRTMPSTDAEIALAEVAGSDMGDDTDWDALYADRE